MQQSVVEWYIAETDGRLVDDKVRDNRIQWMLCGKAAYDCTLQQSHDCANFIIPGWRNSSAVFAKKAVKSEGR